MRAPAPVPKGTSFMSSLIHHILRLDEREANKPAGAMVIPRVRNADPLATPVRSRGPSRRSKVHTAAPNTAHITRAAALAHGPEARVPPQPAHAARGGLRRGHDGVRGGDVQERGREDGGDGGGTHGGCARASAARDAAWLRAGLFDAVASSDSAGRAIRRIKGAREALWRRRRGWRFDDLSEDACFGTVDLAHGRVLYFGGAYSAACVNSWIKFCCSTVLSSRVLVF